MPRLNRCMSGRFRYTRSNWERNILTRQQAYTTWRSCTTIKAAKPKPNRCISGRFRYTRRFWDRNILIQPDAHVTMLCYFVRWGGKPKRKQWKPTPAEYRASLFRAFLKNRD